MKRASYREAILWIATNDDTEWLEDDDPIPSVTAVLVADVFDLEVERVTSDLRKAVGKAKARDR